jgi:hypothetical protein
MIDVRIINEGIIIGFQPITAIAKEWFDENVQSERWQWLGNVLGIDHRYAEDIIAALAEAGMEVQFTRGRTWQQS